MEQFPFAVDNSNSSSPIVPAVGDDSSSLVTASSQGSFVPTSEDDGMHSSSQQHTDDELVGNHDAVFANLSVTPIVVQQPQLPPVVFGATIVDLPPSSQALPSPTHKYQSNVADPTSSTVNSVTPSILSGVDALKSAGNRVTSVLSNLGYNLGINSNTGTVGTATIRTSNTTMSTPISISNHHYEPPINETTVTNITAAGTTSVNDEAIDFAYINVTDEDEVDVWLDDSHAKAYRNSMGVATSQLGNENVDRNHDVVRRGNILAVLLANDNSVPSNVEGDRINTSESSITNHSERLFLLTEKANEMSAQAVNGRKNGDLQLALDRHSDSSKLFHQAALHVRDHDGKYAMFSN
jgi:hypothetical protein